MEPVEGTIRREAGRPVDLAKLSKRSMVVVNSSRSSAVGALMR